MGCHATLPQKTAVEEATYSQEHFTTIAYAKFGGQTEWIMGNWKIENANTKRSRKIFLHLG